MKGITSLLSRAGVVLAGSALVAQATYAEGLADLAAGIDKADIVAGMTAVALLVGAVLATRMGIRKVLGMIR